mgnify:CR=1 FL=1
MSNQDIKKDIEFLVKMGIEKMPKTGEDLQRENAQMREDIEILIDYIFNVTGRDFENCAGYEVCKKYE